MKIISANTNGIRAAASKGFFDWVLSEDLDVICIQETKAHEQQLLDPVFNPAGYFRYFSEAEKKGYSGVAIYTKKKPDKIIHALGFDLADTEGRYVQVDFDDLNLSICSLYLPSGSSSELRQVEKIKFMGIYENILKNQMASGRSFIVCGDWNIVHKEIDIKNFKSNQKSSGCLPEERAWLDQILNQEKWVDAFRVLNQEPDQYTWWSARQKRCWDHNIGWRIDYQIVTPDLKNKIKKVEIYKAQRFSDHAPVLVEYDL